MVPAQVLGDIRLRVSIIPSMQDISAKDLVPKGFNEPSFKMGWLSLLSSGNPAVFKGSRSSIITRWSKRLFEEDISRENKLFGMQHTP